MVLPLLQLQLDLDVVPDPQFANSRLYRHPFGAFLITLTLQLTTGLRAPVVWSVSASADTLTLTIE